MSLTGIGSGVSQSLLTMPVQMDNMTLRQSAQLAVSNTSSSITFTVACGTIRTSAMITNAGTVGCYLASGVGSATAITSSSTPSPTASATSVSNCTYLAPGGVYSFGFEQGTNTLAAITSSSTTTLEISFGYGS